VASFSLGPRYPPSRAYPLVEAVAPQTNLKVILPCAIMILLVPLPIPKSAINRWRGKSERWNRLLKARETVILI